MVPDEDRAQDRAIERQHERTETVEDILAHTSDMLGEHKYPTTSEELATEYADQPLDLPNETETIGHVFDRLVDERYESREEAVEALYTEVTGEAAGMEEYNEERALGNVAEAEEGEGEAGNPASTEDENWQ